ncbi:MAG: hypothetical protein MZV64_23355 [Ignavibacteriales bacterium]|nr:hypothetical protein [Ignavibacteriales bacterium]
MMRGGMSSGCQVTAIFQFMLLGRGGEILNEGNELSNRGSIAIRIGKETNTYAAVCKGNELSLEINGNAVETVITKCNFQRETLVLDFPPRRIYLLMSSLSRLQLADRKSRSKLNRPTSEVGLLQQYPDRIFKRTMSFAPGCASGAPV